MRCAAISTLLAIALASLPVQADECTTTQSDLVKLIDQVSRTTGQKFVLDPRVRAQVTLSGIETGSLDYPTLRSILAVHGFTALEADGVIYVVHESVAEDMRAKLGVDASRQSGT
jgi:type II secretory pathway component GspD/PulD (secretin)